MLSLFIRVWQHANHTADNGLMPIQHKKHWPERVALLPAASSKKNRTRQCGKAVEKTQRATKKQFETSIDNKCNFQVRIIHAV